MHARNDKSDSCFSPGPEWPCHGRLDRREFLKRAAAGGAAAGLAGAGSSAHAAQTEALQPFGEAKGLNPGRVVWVRDPHVTNWKGPGDGRWYEGNRTSQDRVDAMLERAVGELTGQSTAVKAWDKLFRHLNQARGKGDVAYKPGEKVVIKPNWVGMIWREGTVDPKSYTLVKREVYMNTAPQMVIALVRQLLQAGVREPDIAICDTLAYLVQEYYDILHKELPKAKYIDHAGKFGRIQVKPSEVPLYWSCRPQGKLPDFVPLPFAEAEYQVNFATLKAHAGTGVTLCGKNHFGSFVRWPVQEGYYDTHTGCFAKKRHVYREQVDLLGHAHLGGKTVLYLIDGLFSGVHPIDQAPQKCKSPGFEGDWAKSLLASQDPVAIDSVAVDFLREEFSTYPHWPNADDYLHEAALADHPPSGTFYDPDHATPTKRLPSLGVHEHWNNAREKKYSRNLGVGKGIELVMA